MSDSPLHVVTGALGYTGRAIAERLLAKGLRVRTLTNSPNRPDPFGGKVEIRPLAFDDPGALRTSLEGAAVLYNTYWVRFNHRLFTFEQGVANTKVLFEAAKAAGVARIVHVSILHATKADDLGYYRGKHELERALVATGMSHAILRPGVLFGRGDILVNNIAWVLRHLPFFGTFGDGRYRLRPMHVDDMGELAVQQGFGGGNTTTDAVGTEGFTYRELVETIGRIVGIRRPIIPVPPLAGLAVSKLLNPFVGDVVITRQEIAGLMRGLLDSPTSSAGPTRLTEWATEHKEQLGRRYASEVGRRVKRDVAYEQV